MLLVTSQAISRIEEDPTIVLDLFFSKLRADCLRIQNNERDSPLSNLHFEPLPENIDLVQQFSIPSNDPVLRQHQIRKLSLVISRSVDGDEFLRWLSKTLRMVMYRDLDILDDLDISNGVLISQFLDCGAAPSFVEEYVKNEAIGMLLHLVGFEKLADPDTFKFPANIEIETVEAVERAKMFQRRTAPPSKTMKKQRKTIEHGNEVDSDEEVSTKKKPPVKEVIEYKSEMVQILYPSSL
jgi:hypothetical protein